MSNLYIKDRYEQVLAPVKTRVKTWDDDVEFGLALVDRQFDSMFAEAHVLSDRPPHDSATSNPDTNWSGYLYLRTARELSYTIPLDSDDEYGMTRVVTMAADTGLMFPISMQRLVRVPKNRNRYWSTAKRPRFVVGAAYPAYSMTKLTKAADKWDVLGGSTPRSDIPSVTVNLGSWDCVTNYRDGNEYRTMGDGKILHSTQPSFKSLKALGVSMWGVVMAHAAHGDGFDGRIGRDSVHYYRDQFGIRASDDWATLPSRGSDGDFTCWNCGEVRDEDNYWGDLDGNAWCNRCADDHISYCEWCDRPSNNGLESRHMAGNGFESYVCSSCCEDLLLCPECEAKYVDTNEASMVTVMVETVEVEMCPDCVRDKGASKCKECGIMATPVDVEGRCMVCADEAEEKEEEATCNSMESGSSV